MDGRTDGRWTDERRTDGWTNDEPTDGGTTDGRTKKIPTKKFRKNLDEKIPKKICDRARKLGGKARGQGMVAAGAWHG